MLQGTDRRNGIAGGCQPLGKSGGMHFGIQGVRVGVNSRIHKP
jgi:hypothetical protein